MKITICRSPYLSHYLLTHINENDNCFKPMIAIAMNWYVWLFFFTLKKNYVDNFFQVDIKIFTTYNQNVFIRNHYFSLKDDLDFDFSYSLLPRY